MKGDKRMRKCQRIKRQWGLEEEWEKRKREK